VDISGHPPFPTGSKQFSGNFDNLLFLAVFHFRSRFEALKDVFWENGEKYQCSFYIPPKMNILDDTFHANSHHHPNQKLGVLKTLATRAIRISDEANLEKEIDHITKTFNKQSPRKNTQ
jgi:hypothetical protein